MVTHLHAEYGCINCYGTGTTCISNNKFEICFCLPKEYYQDGFCEYCGCWYDQHEINCVSKENE